MKLILHGSAVHCPATQPHSLEHRRARKQYDAGTKIAPPPTMQRSRSPDRDGACWLAPSPYPISSPFPFNVRSFRTAFGPMKTPLPDHGMCDAGPRIVSQSRRELSSSSLCILDRTTALSPTEARTGDDHALAQNHVFAGPTGASDVHTFVTFSLCPPRTCRDARWP